MQNLASVQRIIKLDPIEGADFILTATVLGWQVVVKKDEFKVGDLVAYIQIDTVVPEKEQFEFLRERAFRVRTIKLRKQISQGLIVPLPAGEWKEGDDLTEVMAVRKYEKGGEVPGLLPRKPKVWYKKWWFILKYNYLVKVFPNLNSFNRAGFPKHIVPITDEERIQNIPHVLEQYKDKGFVISEKLDGSSITIIRGKKWNGKPKYRVCSRRFELFNDKNEWHKVFYSTNFAQHIEKLVSHFKTANIAVQGEFIGSPQGNKYQLKENDIRLFNIYVYGKRLKPCDFVDICDKLDIPAVPFLSLSPMSFTLPDMLAYAEGKSVLNEKTEREGLVFRCADDGLSFKAISNKYLLLNKE